MKSSLILFAMLLLFMPSGNSNAAQKRRKNSAKPAAASTKAAAAAAPAVPVRVRYTNGSEIFGRLVDINLKTVTVDAGNGKVYTTTLQEIASLGIGETAPKVDAQFLTDADAAYRVLQALAVATDGNISYGEYQPKVADAKKAVEAFITKHERSSNQVELFRTLRAAVRSFELVSPVWSLRFGQEQHKYVIEGSDQLRPIMEMYPDIKTVAWRQNERYPIEKVIAWVWIQATKLVDQSKQQMSRLR